MEHIYGALMEINRSVGRIEGDVSHMKDGLERNTGRLDRIERQVRQPRRPRRRRLIDWWPALSGLIALGLALAGKLEWSQALALLRGGGG